MHAFRIDYAMNRGHEMLLDRESGIRRNDLEEIELQMLRSQRIPYLLPVDWLEMDGCVTFRYSLDGTRMLVHRLQQEPLTMEQYYGLVLAVTDVLLDCREYMLRPESFLLSEPFIFAGERPGDLRFVYVPLRQREGHGYDEAGSGLLRLLVRWTSYVADIDGAGLQKLLQLLGGGGWPLKELRETALELIGDIRPLRPDGAGERPGGPAASSAAGPVPAVPPAAGSYSSSAVHVLKPASVRQTGASSTGIHPMERSPVSAGGPEEANELAFEEDEARPNGRRGWLMSAAGLVAAACVWRFVYLASPSMRSLLISGGMTLLLGAGIFYIWRRGGALLMTEGQEEEDGFEPFMPDTGRLRKKKHWPEPEIHPPESTTSSLGNQAIPSEGVRAAVNKPAAAPTMLLGREAGGASEEQICQTAWLKRLWRGKEETIPLESPTFRIGRASEQVGYSDEADGVSRVHIEIERIDGVHHIKDLGSRNGSLLNGQLMIPYKAYKLSAGDTFVLAGEKGPVYTLVSG